MRRGRKIQKNLVVAVASSTVRRRAGCGSHLVLVVAVASSIVRRRAGWLPPCPPRRHRLVPVRRQAAVCLLVPLVVPVLITVGSFRCRRRPSVGVAFFFLLPLSSPPPFLVVVLPL